MESAKNPQIAALRARIAALESSGRRDPGVLPFGLDLLDRRVPGGGLALGALHEIAGGGDGAVHGAAAALFTAGIAARTPGQVLWCVMLETRRRTRQAITMIAGRIAPGMAEDEGVATAKAVLKELGLPRGWHKTYVRFGRNTVRE